MVVIRSWIKGDYDGLFSFLDNIGAKECVNNLAYFTYECKTSEFVEEIQKTLEKEVAIDKNDRFYIIWRTDSGSIKGKFLFGGRKRAPWEGFGNILVEDESDTAE